MVCHQYPNRAVLAGTELEGPRRPVGEAAFLGQLGAFFIQELAQQHEDDRRLLNESDRRLVVRAEQGQFHQEKREKVIERRALGSFELQIADLNRLALAGFSLSQLY